MGELPFHAANIGFEIPNLLARVRQGHVQERKYRHRLLGEELTDLRDDVRRTYRNRDPEFAEQSADRVQTRRPRRVPRRAEARERRDRLLLDALDGQAQD
jgi:hypothetical protein